MKYHYVYKSSVTGKFVSRAYACRHPKLTFKQRVKNKIQ